MPKKKKSQRSLIASLRHTIEAKADYIGEQATEIRELRQKETEHIADMKNMRQKMNDALESKARTDTQVNQMLLEIIRWQINPETAKIPEHISNHFGR